MLSVVGPPPVVTEELLEAWYRAHFVDLVRLGTLACGDPVVAEDAVQEVFAGMIRRPPEVRDVDPLPYLRVSVLNRCRSRMRSRGSRARARERLAGTTATTVDDVERRGVASTTTRDVLVAVRSLPERQRDVVLLRHWLGLSEAEIADTLGISRGTVKSSASRARAALAPILEALR